MSTEEKYRIVRVDKNKKRCHITAVETVSSPGAATAKWTVKEVRKAIKEGVYFYTEDAARNEAQVKRFKCGKCGKGTIRSKADGIPGDNLDNMPPCLTGGH